MRPFAGTELSIEIDIRVAANLSSVDHATYFEIDEEDYAIPEIQSFEHVRTLNAAANTTCTRASSLSTSPSRSACDARSSRKKFR